MGEKAVFFQGQDAAPAYYIFPDSKWSKTAFNKFDVWIERWMGTLYPRTMAHQRAIQDGKAEDDEYMELAFDAQQFGYVVSFLMGCRSMGADFEELMARAKGFMLNDLGGRAWQHRTKERRQGLDQSANSK